MTKYEIGCTSQRMDILRRHKITWLSFGHVKFLLLYATAQLSFMINPYPLVSSHLHIFVSSYSHLHLRVLSITFARVRDNARLHQVVVQYYELMN